MAVLDSLIFFSRCLVGEEMGEVREKREVDFYLMFDVLVFFFEVEGFDFFYYFIISF